MQFQQGVQGDSETEPLADSSVVGPGVDADQEAVAVEQAATAVAGIEGSLRLNDADHLLVGVLPPQLGHDSLGHRPP